MAGLSLYAKLINSRLLHVFWQIVDWLYPPHCCKCGLLGFRICPECWGSIQKMDKNICIRCGDVLNSNKYRICERCHANPPMYAELKSFAQYQGSISFAVQSIKYKRDFGLVEVFISPLKEIIAKSQWQADFICPVPLGVKRKLERGYNQAALIAYWLALDIGLPYMPEALLRVKETTSQVGLGIKEREQNVQHAFSSIAKLVNGRSFIVVDDVATTGATINACAQALLSGGAKRVYGLTIARAIRLEDQIYSI